MGLLLGLLDLDGARMGGVDCEGDRAVLDRIGADAGGASTAPLPTMTPSSNRLS
jgi:hypothetical protein